MASDVTLQTPFRPGEKIVTTRPVGGRPAGSPGKVRLSNGLGNGSWHRYWVRFADGELVGQVDHDDLVRPAMVDDWDAHQLALAEAAANSALAEAAPAEAATGGGGGGGIADQIPAALLERSKAAKARLLGS